MPLVTLDQALAHLKADEDPGSLIEQVYLPAAETTVMKYIGRQVFESQSALDAAVAEGTAGESPIVLDGVIKAAILLMVGDLYTHRENTVVGSGLTPAALPNGSRFLLQPYRANMGV